MRLSEVSIAVVLTLGLDVSAYSASASVAERAEPARQAALMQTEVFGSDGRVEAGNFTFRLEEWLGENGSGGFREDFTDEERRGDSREELPEY
jgi:hypothetical protein